MKKNIVLLLLFSLTLTFGFASFAAEKSEIDTPILYVVGPCSENGIHDMDGKGDTVITFPGSNEMRMNSFQCIHCGEIMFATGQPARGWPLGEYLMPHDYYSVNKWWGVTYYSNIDEPRYTNNSSIEGYNFIY